MLFWYLMTNYNFLIFISNSYTYIYLQDKERFEQPSSTDIAYNWLRKKRMKAFYTEIKSNSLRNGILALMQVCLVFLFFTNDQIYSVRIF